MYKNPETQFIVITSAAKFEGTIYRKIWLQFYMFTVSIIHYASVFYLAVFCR